MNPVFCHFDHPVD